jgi:transposase-like protein
MMDLFSQNCRCCDSAKVDVRTRDTTQNNGTHSISHCRSCDIDFTDTFAPPMTGLRTPLSRIIEVLKARTEAQGLKATARIFGVSKKSIMDWEWRLSELKPALTL